MVVVKKLTLSDEQFGEVPDRINILIDDKSVFYVGDWEAEDANLGRDFSACYNVFWLMKRMYELGKEWVVVEFKEENFTWDVY